MTALSTLQRLLQPQSDMIRFSEMLKAVVAVTVTVLTRQNKKYFGLDITERLTEETRSARSHDTDAEEVIGMLSALQKRSPRATISFLS